MRIGALLRVRLASERLPGKALLDVNGKPAIVHQLERLFAVPSVPRPNVIVCTTTDASDDRLAEVVESAGAGLFRGSPDDVVDRIWQAARESELDAVVQVDGDDISIDPFHAELTLRALLDDDSADVVLCEGLPLGAAVKALRRRAIETVHERYVPGNNGTGAFLYFTEAGLCKVRTIGPSSSDHQHGRARLTLDYPEDLEFFRALFAELERRGVASPAPLAAIVQVLRERPELVEINAFLTDGYWDRSDQILRNERLAYRTEAGFQELALNLETPQWFNRHRGSGEGEVGVRPENADRRDAR